MKPETAPLDQERGHDLVGRYRQDRINGFTDEFLHRMLDLAELSTARSVLDAMAGDGNLTRRMSEHCRRREFPLPGTVVVLEFSQVQAEFARAELSDIAAEVIVGDAVTMTRRDDGRPLPDGAFDRVLIKSANHEIPLAEQARLYESVFRVLAPGGLFVNLGFLFDDAEERDEFREIARVKDTLSGLLDLAGRRHFLTRSELYPRLRNAGFSEIRCGMHFDYTIHSEVVDREYLVRAATADARVQMQEAQIRALRLRRSGRVRFEQEACVMVLPGEITLARKPLKENAGGPAGESGARARPGSIPDHARMLDEAARHVPPGARVLELGCGTGDLAERLAPAVGFYLGIDPSPERVRGCAKRYSGDARLQFQAGDLQEAAAAEPSFDAVVLLNSHNLPDSDPARLLRRALAALRPGGRLVFFAPASADSLSRARKTLPRTEDDDAVRRILERDLGAARGGWSLEGIVTLLREASACDVLTVDTTMYGGLAHLVVAEKRRANNGSARVEDLFQRSLTAHLPAADFEKLRRTSVLVAGLGGGSNIAELLARKGIGRLLLADPDRYEPHNIRQRGSVASAFGREKALVMRERLLDVNPHLEVVAVPEGITLQNAAALVRQADYIVDMIDLHGMMEKIHLYRSARAQGKIVLTAPSVINGAVLYVFAPDGISYERFFELEEELTTRELAPRLLKRLIPKYPPQAPEALYQAAARGERTVPLDAVGVDQAAVMCVAAVESLVLSRREQVVFVPRGIHVDASDPTYLARIIDFSGDFAP